MSIPFSGTFTRSKGVVSAIAKQLRSVTLKPIKNIAVKFDPFNDNVTHTRNFLFHISSQKILLTNPDCSVKTDILCDRADPSITFTLVHGDTIIFRSGNLTTLELLQLYNKHITVLAPVEQVPAKIVKTKSEKKIGGKRR